MAWGDFNSREKSAFGWDTQHAADRLAALIVLASSPSVTTIAHVIVRVLSRSLFLLRDKKEARTTTTKTTITTHTARRTAISSSALDGPQAEGSKARNEGN
eukprot:scaffold50109_cov27-Prasinocladus_malaysianus.AAC.1